MRSAGQRTSVGLRLCSTLLLVLPSMLWGQTKPQTSSQSEPDQSERIDTYKSSPGGDDLQLIDQSNATVTGGSRVLKLFGDFPPSEFSYFKCADKPPASKPKFSSGQAPTCTSKVYGILHVLVWNNNKAVAAQNWYLYSFQQKDGTWQVDDISKSAHLAGAAGFYFLFLQLNVDTASTPDPYYIVNVTKKMPANLSHLLALAQASGLNTSGAAKLETMEALPKNAWGGGYVALKYKTSTLQIEAMADNDTTTPTQLAQTTYDNEGPLFWDISVGVPLRKISQVQIDNANGTLAPVSVDKTNVLAIMDGYYPGLDPTSNVIDHLPHPIAGVALASQPLHKILVGGAWGPSFSEVYVGAMWVKQPLLPSGSCSAVPSTTTSAPTAYHFCKQLSIGLNLQISSILSQITKK